MSGKIESEDEKNARKELNKMGLAVLKIGTEPITGSGEAGKSSIEYEFDATDSAGKQVDGTIEAVDLIAAYTRLAEEFHFRVTYLCQASASDAEKAKARKDGIGPLLAAQQAALDEAEAQRSKGFKGSLENLVKKAENRFKGEEELKDNAKAKLNLSEALPSAAEVAAKAAAAKPKEPESAPPKPKLKLQDAPKKPEPTKSEPVGTQPLAVSEEPVEPETPPKPAAEAKDPTRPQPSRSSTIVFGLDLGQLFAKGKALLSQPIGRGDTQPAAKDEEAAITLESETKETDTAASQQPTRATLGVLLRQLLTARDSTTRSAAWQAIRHRYAVQKTQQSTGRELAGILRKIHRPLVLERIWIWLGEFLSVMIFMYLSYFIISTLALRYEWGSFSTLAETTIARSTLIPYLAFSLMILRILVSLRVHVLRHIIATFLVFAAGGLLIFILGVNLLYS
jgi:hypothetical protein